MTDTQSAPTTVQRVREAVANSVVSVGRDGRGTGFVVADGKVLTNAHNLRDRTTSITFDDGRVTQAEVAGIDVDGDLVVLAVDTAGAPTLTWGDSNSVADGSEVYSAGRGGGRLRITRGDVTGVDAEFRGPRGRTIRGGLEHTAPMARGASGGPVVDAAGAVVAVNTHRAGEGFYLARLADDALQNRVAKLVAGERVETPKLGVTLAPSAVAQKLRAAVGLSPREGLLVRAVADDSAAAAAGIKEGDLIVGAGDTAVVTIDDLHTALDAAVAGSSQSITLRLVSGDTERETTVTWAAS